MKVMKVVLIMKKKLKIIEKTFGQNLAFHIWKVLIHKKFLNMQVI